MPKSNNPDPHSWFNEWRKPNDHTPKHRLTEYFKEIENMDISNNFDDFFKHAKDNVTKADWEKFVKQMQNKSRRSDDAPSMVVMFEDDYENLIEMRGLFKNTNRLEYVETINKILGNLRPPEGL